MGCAVVFCLFLVLVTIGAWASGETDSALLLTVIVTAICGGVIYFSLPPSAAKREKEREREREREREEEQRNALSSISDIVFDPELREKLSDLRRHHNKAKTAFDKAEALFKNNAYSPFWDAVEQATLQLSYFSGGIYYLSEKLKDYRKYVAIYNGDPEMFPITPDEMEEVDEMSRKLRCQMTDVVRPAQQDFHFASIFEQRRTQESIAEGFNTFENAINDVGDRITSEVSELNYEMSSMMRDASDQRERHHDEVMEADTQRAEREEQALEMLEDISNRRNRRS